MYSVPVLHVVGLKSSVRRSCFDNRRSRIAENKDRLFIRTIAYRYAIDPETRVTSDDRFTRTGTNTVPGTGTSYSTRYRSSYL